MSSRYARLTPVYIHKLLASIAEVNFFGPVRFVLL
jgi:hypothetical protein